MNKILRSVRVFVYLIVLITVVVNDHVLAQINVNLKGPSQFIDHSLLISPELPCTWPSIPFPRFQLTHQRVIGPESNYNVDVLLIDGNTGTQMDVPPHSVARPELKRDKSGPLGLAYTDTYYRPLPEGSRFIAAALDRKAPGYPDPDPDCMEFLATRGVMTLGTDSPSMGPLPDLAEPTHYAGLKHGMTWTESATNLGLLPPTGAFYCMLGPKHQGGPYGEGRAFSVVGGELPKQLIDAAKRKRVIDLSPTRSCTSKAKAFVV